MDDALVGLSLTVHNFSDIMKLRSTLRMATGAQSLEWGRATSALFQGRNPVNSRHRQSGMRPLVHARCLENGPQTKATSKRRGGGVRLRYVDENRATALCSSHEGSEQRFSGAFIVREEWADLMTFTAGTDHSVARQVSIPQDGEAEAASRTAPAPDEPLARRWKKLAIERDELIERRFRNCGQSGILRHVCLRRPAVTHVDVRQFEAGTSIIVLLADNAIEPDGPFTEMIQGRPHKRRPYPRPR